MKTKAVSKILLSLGLVFMLGSAITQVHGDTPVKPYVTIHSTGDVTRGAVGSFVLEMTPPLLYGGTYVNFSVSGNAVPGLDYVTLVPPTYVAGSGYGVILVQTLPDTRASVLRRAYDVIVTLKPGLTYELGEPRSAKITIQP